MYKISWKYVFSSRTIILKELFSLRIMDDRSTWEIFESSVLMDEASPAEIEFLTTKDSFHRYQLNRSKHMACNLLNQRKENSIIRYILFVLSSQWHI